MHTSNIDPKQIGYSWVPPGIVTSSKIQKYFDLLPKEKVPKIGSVGERYRIRQLNYQLPKQDIDYAYCKHVGVDKECFEEFVTTRNEIALDVGYIRECGTNTACANCKEQINQNELAVNATKFSNRVIWHPRCFQCCVCNELLVDLTYCAFEEKIFCERHYAEIFKPRCNACDEGTADKPSRKTSHEKDESASDTHACELLDTVDNYEPSCSIDTNMTKENPDVAHDIRTASEPNRMIKKVDNLPNLNHYFNDAMKSEMEEKKNSSVDAITPITPMPADKSFDLLDVKSRDDRSSTLYSRSDSESSNPYRRSSSRDSSPRYFRTDSGNTFIQDELDSEEYHHNHRFSMTAEALEYIRGRDDWRDHTENILNNRYRRQSSNISISEQIDSDEYHHDRKVSDLVEIAYLDAESIKSLPSSFKDGNMFDRYYLELQQIKGQLSNDIEQNIAQKQVILLDSSDIENAEGYVYPLPDIIIDQVNDNGDVSYTVEQIDSDYSNLSESEDDIQSVIEVNHSNSYDGEVITTLDGDEMIEVTLWDFHDDITKEHSSKESSIEVISLPIENQLGDQQIELETTSNTSEANASNTSEANASNMSGGNASNTSEANADLKIVGHLSNEDINLTKNTASDIVTLSDSSEKSNVGTGEVSSKQNVNKLKRVAFTLESDNESEVQTVRRNLNESQESQMKSESSSQMEDKLLGAVGPSANQRSASPGIESSKSFIAHESSSSAPGNSIPTIKADKTPKTVAAKPNKTNDIDNLIMEGSMGVWFHN